MARLESIYRYPVKGLSPEKLDRARLTAGAYFPGDRLFAIENGPSGFDPAAPVHQPKTKFLMLMRDERLATLRTRYDDATGTLSIEQDGPRGRAGGPRHQGRPAGGRGLLPPLHAARPARPARRCWQRPRAIASRIRASGFVSIINLASVAELETAHRRCRFTRCASARTSMSRAGRPGANSTWSGREFAIGAVRLKVTKRIMRCAATNVDPDTGIRDLTIPNTLMQNFDHMDCGIYAQVIEGGEIAPGDAVSP